MTLGWAKWAFATGFLLAPLLWLLQFVAGVFPLPNPFYYFGEPPVLVPQNDLSQAMDVAVRQKIEGKSLGEKLEILERSGMTCMFTRSDFYRCDYEQPFFFPYVSRSLMVTIDNNKEHAVRSVRVDSTGP